MLVDYKKNILWSWNNWETLWTRKDFRNKNSYVWTEWYKKKFKKKVNQKLRKLLKIKELSIKWWEYKKLVEYKREIY